MANISFLNYLSRKSSSLAIMLVEYATLMFPIIYFHRQSKSSKYCISQSQRRRKVVIMHCLSSDEIYHVAQLRFITGMLNALTLSYYSTSSETVHYSFFAINGMAIHL